MSSSLTALDVASLALLTLLGLLVLWSRREQTTATPPDEAGDWWEDSGVEHEATTSSQPALALTLLDPTTGDGDPSISLPGDLAVLSGPTALPARLRSSDPASAPLLALLDPAARPGDEATAANVHPIVVLLARLLVIALALVVLLHRLLFG